MNNVRIQSNVAIQNYRQQNHHAQAMTASLRKLSTGYQITSASDDAAGLGISEKMRAQIRGLSQAQANIEQGILLLQTADAGLGEIANPNLVRLRELAIQAATDTLTATDRMTIQSEVTQILQGIDTIANQTHYNERDLLNVGATKKTDKNVISEAKSSKIVGEIIVPNPPVPFTLEIEALFNTMTGADYPDLNIIAPNGKGFGYEFKHLGGAIESSLIHIPEADHAWYTGYAASDEKMIFTNPMPGKWQIQITNSGSLDSTFNLTSNYPFELDEDVSSTNKAIKLHIGANEGESLAVALTNVTTEALQLTKLNMETRQRAGDALSQIDRASAFISAERARFGSYTNRLEHIHAMVANYHENLTQAESTLRDTNMTKEMTQLTMKQLSLQAAQSTSMHVKAQVQSTLQLLKTT